ncbi:MAG: helix-turn-helix domain-containing protein [Anditalea sp.]
MEVICLESAAFYALIDEVVDRMKEADQGNKMDKWISEPEAMRLLRVSSKTTISDLRNNGEIRYTQPRKKIILYDRDSITDYLEKHARETF